MRAASTLAKVGELTLTDAAAVCSYLAERDPDSARTSRALARLGARVAEALSLDLEAMDRVFDLVAALPDDERYPELVRFCDRADRALAGRG